MRLMHKIRSTRFVLTFWYSVILLAAFAIFGAGVYVYLRHLQEAELERNLLEEVDWIARLVDVERSHIDVGTTFASLSGEVERRLFEHYKANPRNYVVFLSSLRGVILYESGSGRIFPGTALPPDRTILQSVRTTDDKTYQMAARRTDPFVIQVAYPDETTQAVSRQLLSIFAVLAPVVLFVAFAGGWTMAGMVLRPIQQISDLAQRISARNLSERIPARDVDDELSELIRTINGMIARLQASFNQIHEFSMSVAHELKTPLTIMKGESELALSRTLPPEETQQLITTYLEEATRMSRIVDDLLTLARADAGQMRIQSEELALEKIIDDLHEDALVLATPKQLTVTLHRNEPAIITGDPARLRQLFRALLSNAVQYTDPGGRVSITSIRKDGNALVSIEDTGIGIPTESLDKIFERFYRVDQARTRVKGGSGLGLSIAKWIADAHHGFIEVSSVPGAGSRFTVRLPLSSRPATTVS